MATGTLLARARQELRRRLRRPLRAVADPVLVRVARLHRSRRADVELIGVTGSCGKTTTKDLVAAICARRGAVVATRDSRNSLGELLHFVLSLRRGTKFCVAELSGAPLALLDEGLPLLRPRIGVVTTIGTDHYTLFRSPEATAAHKAKLIASLPPDGVAVLNADDPHVLGMRGVSQARVLTYGRAAEADVCASQVRADWPERLSFEVRHGDQVLKVGTRFCGEHSLTSVLAALAAGVAAGIPLDEAVAAVSRVEPRLARMQPFEAAGVTFIRDEWKAPSWSIPPVLEFVARASAPRKVIVLGTISDMPGNSGRKYRRLARQALEVADHVLVVNPTVARSLAPLAAQSGGRLEQFATARDARDTLRELLRPGDLVVLKGSGKTDHLERIPLSWRREVRCWRRDCRRQSYCDSCALLAVPERKRASPDPAGPRA